MEFLDPKERVIDIQLTPYGKYLLSQGDFKPSVYAFFDDDIVYDQKFYSSQTSENQNNIEPRIQEETPRIAAQSMYRGAEIGVFESNPNTMKELMPGIYPCRDGLPVQSQSPDKGYILYDPLGTSAYNSDKMPAWSVNFLKAPLVSADVALTGTNKEIPTTFIPQLHCDIKNVVDKVPSNPELQSIFYGDGGDLKPVEKTDSEIYDDQIVFPDGTSLEYTKDFILLQIEEANTEFLKENLEIEVFEIVKQNNALGQYSEVLKKIYFNNNNNEDSDTNYVEYYFDIEVDTEIDAAEFCSLVNKSSKIENIYSDNTFICPDKTKTPTVSLNIYSTGDNEKTEDVC